MVEITKIEINKKANTILLTGIDTESLWWSFQEEPTEENDCKEVTYKFDIQEEGHRRYLYLITSHVLKNTEKLRSMDARIKELLGKSVFISENFLVKDVDEV